MSDTDNKLLHHPVTEADRFCNAFLSELSHATGRVNMRDEALLVDAYYQSIHHRPSSLVGLARQTGGDPWYQDKLRWHVCRVVHGLFTVTHGDNTKPEDPGVMARYLAAREQTLQRLQNTRAMLDAAHNVAVIRHANHYWGLRGKKKPA